MTLQLHREELSALGGYLASEINLLKPSSPFILPAWLESWWTVFGEGYEKMIFSAWSGGELIGLAPLMRRDEEAFLIGSSDVCDYLDFVVKPGAEKDFLESLLPELQKAGIKRLVLHSQRPDAVAFQGLFAPSADSGWRADFSRKDLSFILSLPHSWEDYLMTLNKKQRHEVRRKLRRLKREEPAFVYRHLAGEKEVVAFLPSFYDLFLQNPEKKDFMSKKMERYFRLLVRSTASAGIARFAVLEIESEPAAAVLYFDYANRIWLYNSGFSSNYKTLSVGLLSKLLLLKESIEKGRQIFDFLKGQETYKIRLGSTPIPIYQLSLSQ